MPTLSVLYVIRNEQDCLEKSVASIEQIADEIVFIDTGSMDKTLSICRRYPKGRIYSHAWVHDYSRTKNYGIKQCKGDWILALDADELLDPASASAIRNAVNTAKSNISAFGCHFSDHEAAFDYKSPENPRPFFASPQIRLFRRSNQIEFKGRIMENVVDSAKKAGGVDLLNAKIHHFLWHGKGADFKEGRLSYYKKLGANISDVIAPSEVIKQIEMNQTGIVIVAHNALVATKECVSSVARHTKSAFAFQFVDNGSFDGTYEYLRGLQGGRTPIRNTQNLGVAKAKNAGAREFVGNPEIKYVCFLDNDTRVTEDWLERMTSVLEKNPKIGLIGPLSNNADGPQNLFEQSNSKEALATRDPEFMLVDSINGFCMVMTNEALRKVGLFDESFGQYGFEEKDLCQRMKQAGYEIAVSNRAFVEHIGRVTVAENKMDWQKMELLAGTKYSLKWTVPMPAQGTRAPATIRQEQHPKFSFVILVHNRLDMTKQCIDSILATVSNFELIIVDNGSTDNSVEWIKSRVPNAVIIRNEKNLGVPIARNQGIKASTTDYLVIMDNDVICSYGWFEDMFQVIRQGYDAVGLEGWQIDYSFSASYKCNDPKERFDYLGGACTIFKRKVFETVGLLDEGFSPAYYEDVDISVRAKAAGFKLSYYPTTKLVHKEHATLIHCQRNFKYQEAIANSHARFAKKMRGELRVQHEHLSPVSKKLKILYLGMQWDYGVRERGTSFEHDNFYPAVKQWDKVSEFQHFDFVDLGKLYGLGKMSDLLYERVQSFCPDAIFSVFFDENHDPRRDIVQKIRRTTPTKVVSWFCDSHYRYENFDRQWAEFVDYCVTTSTGGLEKYRRDGLGSKVIKSQWAAAPSYNYMPEVQKDIDVLFVGQPHGDRRQIIDHLRKSGLNVQTYGHGWDRRLSFDEMILHFNRAKINLNLSNGADVRVKQIKGRNFEVPGCGGFLLTGMAENLNEYYDVNREISIYNNTNELVDKCRHYLTHPEERQAIALAGYERTMKEHRYSNRFDHIFKAAGLL